MLLLNYTKVFKVLANQLRLELMLLLLDGELHSVDSLSRKVDCSVATTLRQLGMLTKHRLVKRSYKELTPYFQLRDDFPGWLRTLLTDVRSQTEPRFNEKTQTVDLSKRTVGASQVKSLSI